MSISLATADPPAADAETVCFDRPLLLTQIDIDGTSLHIINVHLRAPLATRIPGQKLGPFAWKSISAWAEGYYLSGIKRTSQALELRLLVDEIFAKDESALVLVAGDFNAEDHETPLRIVIGAPEDTGNSALAAGAMVALDRAVAPARRFSVLHHGRPQMLDHMLASHALYGRFRDFAIHNEALGDEAIGYGKDLGPVGSYHAGLVATFAI